jgi:hypothetical protein
MATRERIELSWLRFWRPLDSPPVQPGRKSGVTGGILTRISLFRREVHYTFVLRRQNLGTPAETQTRKLGLEDRGDIQFHHGSEKHAKRLEIILSHRDAGFHGRSIDCREQSIVYLSSLYGNQTRFPVLLTLVEPEGVEPSKSLLAGQVPSQLGLRPHKIGCGGR